MNGLGRPDGQNSPAAELGESQGIEGSGEPMQINNTASARTEKYTGSRRRARPCRNGQKR